jgi:hypothetical protein
MNSASSGSDTSDANNNDIFDLFEEAEAQAQEDLLILEAELAELELEDEIEQIEQEQQLDGMWSALDADSSGYGLTPYFDPFFSMFGAFSSQLPSLVLMQVTEQKQQMSSSSSSSSSSTAAADAAGAKTADALAALEMRIQQLEQSNLLLAADFTTNAEAFWDVCTADVRSKMLLLVDSQFVSRFGCFDRSFGPCRRRSRRRPHNLNVA